MGLHVLQCAISSPPRCVNFSCFTKIPIPALCDIQLSLMNGFGGLIAHHVLLPNISWGKYNGLFPLCGIWKSVIVKLPVYDGLIHSLMTSWSPFVICSVHIFIHVISRKRLGQRTTRCRSGPDHPSYIATNIMNVTRIAIYLTLNEPSLRRILTLYIQK